MNESDITIRLMTEDETPQLQALLQRCYGDSYYDALYCDQKSLAKAIANNDQYSMVAVNSRGEFVAHTGLRNHRDSFTADTSMAIVDPHYRANGLFVKVGAAMYSLYEQLKLSGLYLQAVTIHPYTQQASIKGGGSITGIYLNYTPAFTRFVGINSLSIEKPSPAVIILQPLHINPPPSRGIIWPERYRAILQDVYRQCQLSRDELNPNPLNNESIIRIIKKPRQKIAYLWVDQVSEDLTEKLIPLISELDRDSYSGIYLQLPLGTSNLDSCIEATRNLGFFYAGTMPEYGQRDWLSLQRLDRNKIDLTNIYFANDDTRALLDFVLND